MTKSTNAEHQIFWLRCTRKPIIEANEFDWWLAGASSGRGLVARGSVVECSLSSAALLRWYRSGTPVPTQVWLLGREQDCASRARPKRSGQTESVSIGPKV